MTKPSQPRPTKARVPIAMAALCVLLFLLPSAASATPLLIPDETAFIALAQPSHSEEWRPHHGPVYYGDGVIIKAAHGRNLVGADADPEREGVELLVSSHESLVFTFAQPRASFGLEVLDGAEVDSNWDITFYRNGEIVFETFFEGVVGQWAFVGVLLLDDEFDTVRFIEDNGHIENDMFGNFYSGGPEDSVLAGLPL